MTEQEEQAQKNRRLLELAGFIEADIKPPNLFEDIAACFQWLVKDNWGIRFTDLLADGFSAFISSYDKGRCRLYVGKGATRVAALTEACLKALEGEKP